MSRRTQSTSAPIAQQRIDEKEIPEINNTLLCCLILIDIIKLIFVKYSFYMMTGILLQITNWFVFLFSALRNDLQLSLIRW